MTCILTSKMGENQEPNQWPQKERENIALLKGTFGEEKNIYLLKVKDLTAKISKNHRSLGNKVEKASMEITKIIKDV